MLTQLLGVSPEVQKAITYTALGSLSTLGVCTALGYLPLWFGPEVRAWNRDFWDGPACAYLDELDSNPDFYLYRPQESNRNFLQTGPYPDSTPERRIRRVFYFSRKLKTLRGVVSFGADTEGPPRCVHGGCTAAFVDAALGVCAYRTHLMPCVTANLNVNYREKIPLGSMLGIECTFVESSGLRKSKFSFRLFSLREPSHTYADGDALFVNAIIPSNKTGLPPFLALR